jgi:Putative adhesin
MRTSWLLAVAAVGLAGTPARGDEWSHRYPLKGSADLHVKTDDGSVRVETGDFTEVTARVTTEGWPIGPDGASITESQSGDRIEIDVRLPRQRSWHGIERRSVRVVLQVPKRADLDVRTGDGSVSVQPVAGRVTIATGDGSIAAEGLEGDIHLHTGDGSIRASGLSGQLQADTGDGHMAVRGRFELLDLSTGDGGIEAAVEPGSRVVKTWSLKSGDGGITLRVPDDFGAELDAHTGDGNVVVDRPVTVIGTISHSTVRGRLGAGGEPLRIHTGDGSIRLQGL